MTNVFISGEVSIEEAERITNNYSPSVQETADETPESVDNSPITDDERKALDKATEPTFQPVLGEQPTDRAPQFSIPGEWVSPVVRQRQKNAMLLPNIGQINDLDQRISAVARFNGAPKEVATLAQNARLAVGAARNAHESGRHPESRRFAVSQAAKDAVVQEIAKATSAVAALEAALSDPSTQEAWFSSLVSDLDKQGPDVLKALRAALKAYAAFRANVNAAQALAVATGRWDKSWHMSTVSEAELNAPISSLRAAIGFLESDDDYATGRFLIEEYEGIPPHTMAKLRRGAELAGGDSFAAQVYARAQSVMPNDIDARDAIAEKRLMYLLNSNPLTTELLGRHR